MSYDVWIEGKSGKQVTDLSANYTSNVGPMIFKATGKMMSQWNGLPTREVTALCDTAIADLEGRASCYESMNPANGWGSREGLVKFLKDIRRNCRRAPASIFRVSA